MGTIELREQVAPEEPGQGHGHGFATVQPRSAVDYALRTMQSGLVSFSSLADAKANIMITVCSIVLTIGLTQLSSPLLRWPLLFLTFATFGSLLLAIFAVVPSSKYPKRPDGTTGVGTPGFNVLFFGHFAHVPQQQFVDELADTFADDTRLYDAIARDLWGQGHVLAAKKFRLLRWSYLIFLAGVIVTIIAAIWTWAAN